MIFNLGRCLEGNFTVFMVCSTKAGDGLLDDAMLGWSDASVTFEEKITFHQQ